jgi:hypothetical protein
MPWSKTYKVKCPDGSTRTVHKRIDDAFPLDIRGAQSKFSAKAKDGLGALSAEVSADHRSTVENLLVAIDSKNNTLMVKFRAAYLVYITNPCVKDEFLAIRISQLIEMHDRLTEVELGTQSLIELVKYQPSNTDAIFSLFGQLVSKLGTTDSPGLNGQAAAQAIESAREDARKWIKSAEGSAEGPTT